MTHFVSHLVFNFTHMATYLKTLTPSQMFDQGSVELLMNFIRKNDPNLTERLL